MSAGRQATVEIGHLVDERIKNVRAGHDDEHQAQDHAGQRRQVAAHAAALQGIVDGSGEQGDDDAPEDDIEEGAQHPEEGQRDAGQQQEKGAIFKTVVAFEHGDSLPGLRAASVRDSFRYRKRRGQANRLPLRLRSPAVSYAYRGARLRRSHHPGSTQGRRQRHARRRGGERRGVFFRMSFRPGKPQGRPGGAGKEAAGGSACRPGHTASLARTACPPRVVKAALQRAVPCRPAGAAW